MSITDELREWFKDRMFMANGWQEIHDIADRIDADHERELRETAEDIVRDVRREWVCLPLDADGVPIHFGDVLDQFGTPMTVYAMSDPDPDQGDCMLELITDGISDGTWVRARKMRHHKQPKVEDVLREFGRGWHERMDGPETFDIADYVEQYAARLQLRGDE